MDYLWEVGNVLVALFAAGVTGVGLWFAHNYRRQMVLNLAATRLASYAKLWEITGYAAPTRLDGWGAAGGLTQQERLDIWQAMTDWYYEDGNGLLLGEATKSLYLGTKHNLVCKTNELKPRELAKHLRGALHCQEDELDIWARGTLSIRQISLLRTQLKSDLAIYGQPYADGLSDHERIFLEGCKVKLRSRAWKSAVDGAGTDTMTSLQPIATLDIGDRVRIPRAGADAVNQMLGDTPEASVVSNVDTS